MIATRTSAAALKKKEKKSRVVRTYLVEQMQKDAQVSQKFVPDCHNIRFNPYSDWTWRQLSKVCLSLRHFYNLLHPISALCCILFSFAASQSHKRTKMDHCAQFYRQNLGPYRHSNGCKGATRPVCVFFALDEAFWVTRLFPTSLQFLNV